MIGYRNTVIQEVSRFICEKQGNDCENEGEPSYNVFNSNGNRIYYDGKRSGCESYSVCRVGMSYIIFCFQSEDYKRKRGINICRGLI